ncbi:hypothetical protein ACHQM5_006379 [Ranunculus cassubicifolius]
MSNSELAIMSFWKSVCLSSNMVKWAFAARPVLVLFLITITINPKCICENFLLSSFSFDSGVIKVIFKPSSSPRILASCCDLNIYSSSKDVSEISDEKQSIQISLDLVKAARRHLSFLTTVAKSPWLHNHRSLRQAVRRYDELWMPLISDLTIGKTQPVILLPPLDIQWVWHCHTLNPESYRRYCNSRFSKILEKPVLHDDGNEEYALNRCSDLWSKRYPFEPFELDDISDDKLDNITTNEDIFAEVWKNKDLPSKFSEPYMLEMVYLISAKQRYIAFMYLLEKFNDGCSKLVPTLDIQLILLTLQSYPSKYTEDVQRLEVGMEKIVGIWDEMKDEDSEESRKIWEEIFDEPYERAGAIFRGMLKPPVYWVVSEVDVNTRYKLMGPRESEVAGGVLLGVPT